MNKIRLGAGVLLLAASVLLPLASPVWSAECGGTAVAYQACGATQIWNPSTGGWEDYGGTIYQRTLTCEEGNSWGGSGADEEIGSCVPGQFEDRSFDIGECTCGDGDFF
jgi:hypothetical protein